MQYHALKTMPKRMPSAMFLASAGLATVLLSLGSGNTIQAAEPITVANFPKTAARAEFFEQRINAPDATIRARVITEVCFFYFQPDEEFIRFLTAMYHDPDKLVRGRAIKKLYEMWIPQDPKLLPRVFAGYDNRRVIDQDVNDTVAQLIADCTAGGHKAGYAAYALGLLQDKDAISSLHGLTTASNIFIRFTAARALLNCGERTAAVAVFDKMSAEQIERYATGNTMENSNEWGPKRSVEPWYAANACRGLIAAGGKEAIIGRQRLVTLFGYLERSDDPNDTSKVHWVRSMLASLSGSYFTSSKDAIAWMNQQDTAAKQNSDKTLDKK